VSRHITPHIDDEISKSTPRSSAATLVARASEFEEKAGLQLSSKKDEERVEDDEHRGVLGSAGWTPYVFYFQACGWSRISISAFCVIGYTLVEVGLQVNNLHYSPELTSILSSYDQIFLKQWSQSKGTNHTIWLGIYAGLSCASAVAGFVAFTAYTQETTPHASSGIHQRVLDAVLSAAPSYFRTTSPAKLINRFGSDINMIDFVRC
jgi:ABC-type multidrug transport system fused ATPase/permease subunit